MKAHQSKIIGIDARLSGQEHAGIGRYIENLILELLSHDQTNISWVLFFHHQKQARFLELLNVSNYKIVFAPIRHYSIQEQLRWPRILKRENLDLLHIPHFNIPLFYRSPFVITIHDLLWHQQIGPEVTTLPSWKYYLKYVAYRVITAQAVDRAKLIFVPTNSVKTDLLAYKPTLTNKIFVTPEGLSTAFERENECLLTKKMIFENTKNKTLVYVGSLYPHKNIEVVFQALCKLPQYQLKIVCSRNVFVERTKKRVNELQITHQVEFTGYLSDERLIETLQNSLALIQPSKSEGFGLTAIESMAVGTPVIASSLPVFKEIYKDGPLFFDPNSSTNLVEQILKLSTKSVYHHHQHLGLKIAQQYRWLKTAALTYNAYQDALKQ